VSFVIEVLVVLLAFILIIGYYRCGIYLCGYYSLSSSCGHTVIVLTFAYTVLTFAYIVLTHHIIVPSCRRRCRHRYMQPFLSTLYCFCFLSLALYCRSGLNFKDCGFLVVRQFRWSVGYLSYLRILR